MKHILLIFAVFIVNLNSMSCQITKNTNNELSGKWEVELYHKDLGKVMTIITFKNDGDKYEGFTKKGSDRQILGFWKSLLAGIFTGDFKHGSLINISNCKISQVEGKLTLDGIFSSALGNLYFKGYLFNDTIHAKLLNSSMLERGSITAVRTIKELPLDDYPNIIKDALKTAESNIFDPQIIKSSQWKDFKENIQEFAPFAGDDIDIVFAFFYFSRNLPFSHFALLKPDSIHKYKNNETIKNFEFKELSPEIVLLKINSLAGTSEEVDAIFQKMNKHNYKNLIIDLQDNPGGSINAGLRLAQYLFDSTIYGGIFLTKRWFEHNNNPPNINEYSIFQVIDEANFSMLMNGIHNDIGIALKIIPLAEKFNGNLYVLINDKTASTCEPLVYGLKYYKRAVIIGTKTAGAMLNGEMFSLKNNFSLFLPTADYYTIDGKRIDRIGVEPDINIKTGALEKALELIKKK
jgi:hypothetical protein